MAPHPASYSQSLLRTHTFLPLPHTQQIPVTPLSQNSHVSSLVPFTSFFPFPHREKGRCVTTGSSNSHFNHQKKELDPCTARGQPRRDTSSWKKAKKDTKATVCDYVSSADIRYTTSDAKVIKHLHGL